jgi:lysophospholipase L1-like esterase
MQRKWVSGLFIVGLSVMGYAFLLEAVLALFPEATQFPPIDFKRKLAEIREKGEPTGLAWSSRALTKNSKSEVKINQREILPLSLLASVEVPFWWGFKTPHEATFVTFRSDQYGFRNPSEAWRYDRAQLVLLGDSHTIGYSATDGNSFAERLRKDFPATLNLGISGIGPLTELGHLKEFALKKRPKLVLWFFSEETDLADVLNEYETEQFRRYLEPGYTQDLLRNHAAVNTALKKFWDREEEMRVIPKRPPLPPQRWHRLTRVRNLIRVGTTNIKEISMSYIRPIQMTSQKDLEQGLPLMGRVLAEAKRASDEAGAKFLFVMLPSKKRFTDPRRYSRADYDEVVKLARKNGCDVLDLLPPLSAVVEPLELYPSSAHIDDGHWNDKGHALIAEALRPQILASLEK